MALRVLVVGTGHSGTRWAADVLDACGLKSGHEVLFKFDPQPGEMGKWDADANCRAVPWIKSEFIPWDCKVVHLVRHPLMVWRSMYHCPSQRGWAWRSRDWVEGKLGVELPVDPEDFISAFIVLWTEQIKATGRINLTVRLEDGQDWVKTLGYVPRLHVEHKLEYRRAPEGSPAVSWETMRQGYWTERLARLAEEHGYSEGSDHKGLCQKEDPATGVDREAAAA